MLGCGPCDVGRSCSSCLRGFFVASRVAPKSTCDVGDATADGQIEEGGGALKGAPSSLLTPPLPSPSFKWPPSRHVARKTLCQHPVGRGHNAALTIGPTECARSQSKGHQRRELPPLPPFFASFPHSPQGRGSTRIMLIDQLERVEETRRRWPPPSGQASPPLSRGMTRGGVGVCTLPLHRRALVGVAPGVPPYVTP